MKKILILMACGIISLSCERDQESTNLHATIVFPQIFSPNGDDLNDYFKPTIISKDSLVITDYSMEIINTHRQVVFSTHNPDEAWSPVGNNGQYFPAGNYYVFLDVEFDGNLRQHAEAVVKIHYP